MAGYDEFGLFHENAAEAGLAWDGPPLVSRVAAPGLSALRWGAPEQAAEIVFLHGGAQNAHTWDTVALALGRPVLAIDLPGHGRSSWRDDHAYHPRAMAPAVAGAIETLAADARLVVGMSLGGLTSIAVAEARPDLVRRLALVDITPGVNGEKAADVHAFIDGPEYFASFEEILERTVAFNPTRSESSLRRGILHNAHELPDGRWTWRYDRLRMDAQDRTGTDSGPGTGTRTDAGTEGANPLADLEVRMGLQGLWDAIEGYPAPIALLRGALSPVVGDEDVEELRRRRPDAQVFVVDGAGHSIQGDRPVELAALLESLLEST